MSLEPIEPSAESTDTSVDDKSIDTNSEEGQTILTPSEQNADDVAEQAAEAAGLDLTKLTDEYRETGELSEEARKALNDANIGNDYIDNYLQGIKAQEELYELQVHNLAGGKDEYDKLTKFAGSELNEEQIKEVNEALGSMDLDKVKYHLDSIKLRYEQKNGKMGTQLEGDATPKNADVYGGMDDLRLDQRSELYNSSQRERDRVEAKALRSMRAGTL